MPPKDAAHRGRKVSVATGIAALVWVAVIIFVMVRIVSFSASPGPAMAPPPHWPASSQIPLDVNRATLVLFAHPRCPCTRATLGELDAIMARAQGKLAAHVVFIRPAETAQDWIHTDLWRTASAIPGVIVHVDDAGVEAKRFHVATSGATLLYGQSGSLLFSGGITISRGHAGDNPGRSAIVDILNHEPSNQPSTPVFGCSLFGPGDCKGDGAWTK